MSVLMTNPEEKNFVNKITSIISNLGYISEKDRNYTISDHVNYLIKAAESSEPRIKSKIENHIVKLGKKAVPALVEALYASTGVARGMVAMSLIRIGAPSVEPVRKAASNNNEIGWISDYIVNEIEGSESILSAFGAQQSLEAALVG